MWVVCVLLVGFKVHLLFLFWSCREVDKRGENRSRSVVDFGGMGWARHGRLIATFSLGMYPPCQANLFSGAEATAAKMRQLQCGKAFLKLGNSHGIIRLIQVRT